MFLDEVLHLIDGVTILLRLEVGVLGQQPGLGHGGVPGELVHLEDELQMLPSLLPPEVVFGISLLCSHYNI